jgi:hypothetical protein
VLKATSHSEKPTLAWNLLQNKQSLLIIRIAQITLKWKLTTFFTSQSLTSHLSWKKHLSINFLSNESFPRLKLNLRTR